MQKRTSLLLSFKGLHTRMTGQSLSLSRVKKMEPQQAAGLYSHSADQLIAQLQLELVDQLNKAMTKVEQEVLATTVKLPAYRLLQTLPGVGKILGLTITLETGDINRFATAGDYASYGRCVDSKRLSNGKKKGQNNERCGNKYLSWAWVEAANFAQRFDDRCRQFYDRKKAQANTALATKALACKLAKAAWHIMRENKPYDPQRMFPLSGKSTCCLGTGNNTPLDNNAEPCVYPGQNQLP
jgi:transposase